MKKLSVIFLHSLIVAVLTVGTVGGLDRKSVV